MEIVMENGPQARVCPCIYGATRAKHMCPCLLISTWTQAAVNHPATLVVCPHVQGPMCSHAHLGHARAHAHAVVSRWSHVSPCDLEQHGPMWVWMCMGQGVYSGRAQPGWVNGDGGNSQVLDQSNEECKDMIL